MRPYLSDPTEARRYFEAKLSFTTGPAELDRWLSQRENIHIVDVRRRQDYEKGHLPRAVSLPQEDWGSVAAGRALKREALNVVYCYSQVCHLAAEAARQFAAYGYPVMELEGGYAGWVEHELPVESQAPASV